MNPLGTPLPNWKPATLPARVAMAGDHCCLEPLAVSHAASLWSETAELPDLWDYMGAGPFADYDEFAAWIEAQAARDEMIFFAICQPSGRAIGLSSYLRFDVENGAIEVGNLLFSPVLQRTRAATEAMYLMMKAVFDKGFRRYEWKCNALNQPSILAARRLGFVYEGTFRNALVVKGRNRDTAWFSITDAEWPARQRALQKWLAPENFDENGRQIARLAQV